MNDSPKYSDGLLRLEADLARDFERLNHPPADWTPRRLGAGGRPMADVAIVGGGMCGLAAAFALRQLGISNIAHVDRRAEGLEGPWLTYARMQTLRSPKHLTGPVMGMANLTFRAWYEAQGLGWEALDRITRAEWMDYLRWYRRVTGAQVENGPDVGRISPHADHIDVNMGERTIQARRLVLATGREGQAIPRIPAPLARFFGGLVRHSSDEIDFSALKGRRVVVIGLAASAFDNAATALEAGAAEVTLLGRATALPRLNKMKQTVYPGFTHGFADLPDTDKLALLDHVVSFRIAPPRGSVLRISGDPRVRLVLGVEVTAAEAVGDGLRLVTTREGVEADLVILGTGFAIDVTAPPEMAGFSERILRWGDRVPEATGEWGDFPYLGPGFEFLPRDGQPDGGLRNIHCFTHTAQLSLGNLANDIPAVSEGAERLARAIASSLFTEDRAYHRQRLVDYAEPELEGDEWPGLAEWSPPVP